MTRNVQEIIKELTLEEKVSLCSGKDFWNTEAIERLNIPSIMMTDGPHGLRKQEGASDHLGINKSIASTCFPSAAGLACSWDNEMVNKVGEALAEECQAENVSIILGPGANIKRSPLCGRNFEYFSEDPYLSSKLSTSFIKGVQDNGIGTSLKHFAVNNQEYKRMAIDAIVDERTLREIYLASFEGAVKEGKPWSVMSAYNKVNGDYCSENKKLLTDILKEEWEFEGMVVSDWGAVNERADGLDAGLDLEMPSSGGLGKKKILEAIKSGELSEGKLDEAVERILSIVFKAVDNNKDITYSKEEHHLLAREVARECMVLLKNEDHILPIKKPTSISVIGAFAKSPRFQGGGSSHINPTKVDNVYEEIEKITGSSIKLDYSDGYLLDSDEIDEQLIQDAVKHAKEAEITVIFAGLPERYESEGFDRKHMRIPENHRVLIEAVAAVQENVIVVLSNGAPVEMPWLNKVKAVLEGYLGGQAIGGAIADILFGVISPSGKLAETFPQKLVHNPSYLNFPGNGETVEYREGVFVGYRHYDTRDVEPLFPFGYGLSYTTFEYSDLQVNKKQMKDDEFLTVSVKVTNTGDMEGKEVVQLYVKDVDATIPRPEKELKGFKKVLLKSGESTTVEFELDKRAFAYYNVTINDWHVETGAFEILVGKSSREILLKEEIYVESTVSIKKTLNRHSTFGELLEHPIGAEIMKSMGQVDLDETAGLGAGMQEMFMGTSMHNAAVMSNGLFTEEMLDQILAAVNGTNDN
ncbi:glycoside hydrolase family 3 C-terminal domain-containing protein [Niallia circulans]|uniref:glycoside hydrolase family 3 C-terminal domain-containing protein n=1 Tax=Niallia circulans TaxID=1397 RepID=UPI0026E92DF2|nr:glycoside hydrolase family 3 C-terminal domain-containing protein [Niallia circulans]